jgi:hypothetical protein
MSKVPEHVGNEVTHELQERTATAEEHRRRTELVEIIEVILLATVAVTTAWSGYQAARWDGRESLLYQTSSRLRSQANIANTAGGQQRLLDTSTFNTWIQARVAGERQLADLYVRRFSSEYRVAFDAWLRTHPFTNRNAPPGPIFMPEYHNAELERAGRLEDRASAAFDHGTQARETSDEYVRQTVLFATVLFLVAIEQRFATRRVRIAATALAGGLMLVALIGVVGLPRL